MDGWINGWMHGWMDGRSSLTNKVECGGGGGGGGRRVEEETVKMVSTFLMDLFSDLW